MSIYNEEFIREALVVAEEAYHNLEVPVGCVFVKDNIEIIARGSNKPNKTSNATRHAEIEAIDDILKVYDKDVFSTTDLYVTVEPCVMCASALRLVGIRQVYFGCGNDKFGGNGSVFNINSDPQLETSESKPYSSKGGYLYEEAVLLLRKFYIRENVNAPVPQKKANRTLKTEVSAISPHLTGNHD
ncbi:unnamed protein product [Cunninghamella blakesleeana]